MLTDSRVPTARAASGCLQRLIGGQGNLVECVIGLDFSIKASCGKWVLSNDPPTSEDSSAPGFDLPTIAQHSSGADDGYRLHSNIAVHGEFEDDDDHADEMVVDQFNRLHSTRTSSRTSSGMTPTKSPMHCVLASLAPTLTAWSVHERGVCLCAQGTLRSANACVHWIGWGAAVGAVEQVYQQAWHDVSPHPVFGFVPLLVHMAQRLRQRQIQQPENSHTICVVLLCGTDIPSRELRLHKQVFRHVDRVGGIVVAALGLGVAESGSRSWPRMRELADRFDFFSFSVCPNSIQTGLQQSEAEASAFAVRVLTPSARARRRQPSTPCHHAEFKMEAKSLNLALRNHRNFDSAQRAVRQAAMVHHRSV